MRFSALCGLLLQCFDKLTATVLCLLYEDDYFIFSPKHLFTTVPMNFGSRNGDNDRHMLHEFEHSSFSNLEICYQTWSKFYSLHSNRGDSLPPLVILTKMDGVNYIISL